MKKYKYGMRLRGFAPMCQPMNGLVYWEDGDRKYHNYLCYKRELSNKELKDYELDFIGEESDGNQMSKFKVGDVVRIAHKDKYDNPLINGVFAEILRKKDLIVIAEEDEYGDYHLKVPDTGNTFWVNRDDLVKGGM